MLNETNLHNAQH